MAPTLTYCTNLFPAESAADVRAMLERVVPPLRARLRFDRIPLGLYLSNRATLELEDPAALAQLDQALADLRADVVTLNAFPFGGFHGDVVKTDVFRPTWTEHERREYTVRAAKLLAHWIPRGATGSVSTHTGSHKSFGVDDASDERIARAWLRTTLELARLEEDTGRRIVVAIEPEPHSRLETTVEVTRFFERIWLTPLRRAAAEWSVNSSWLEARVRRHVGVCFDACHQAVEFEDAVEAVARLRASGIVIGKIQASSAPSLALPAENKEGLERLRAFAEPRYLHQTFVRRPSGAVDSRGDLGEALDDAAFLAGADELRTHFHVPIFLESSGPLGTTRGELEKLLRSCADAAPLVEIETYTMSAVPGFVSSDAAIVETMAREWEYAAKLI